MEKMPSKIIELFFSFLLSFTLIGCSSSSVYFPDQTFFTPETNNESLKFNFGGGIHSMTEVKVFKDIKQTPPISSGAEINSVGPFPVNMLPIGLFGAIGVINHVDIIYQDGLGLKIGIPAFAPEWPLAIAYVDDGYSYSVSAGAFGFRTDGYQARVSKKSALVSFGYRFDESYLLYSNFVREWFMLHSEIVSNNVVQYAYDENGVHERLGIGLQLKETTKINLLIEANLVMTSFARTPSNNGASIGLGAIYKW